LPSPALLLIPILALLGAATPPATASSPHGAAEATPEDLTPAERMARRFPQPARVGDLIGLPLLDHDDRILARVEAVSRTEAGGILLIARQGAWFGLGGRSIAVPIEAVAMLGRQIAVLDIPRRDVLALPDWDGRGATPIAPDATIRVALTKR
jgi:hypothetical protein